MKMKWNEVAQSCPTLCDPMDCSPPGSLVHGIFQAWILEWVAISCHFLLSILNWLLNTEFCITKNQKMLGCKRILAACLLLLLLFSFLSQWPCIGTMLSKRKKKINPTFYHFHKKFFGGETMGKDWEIECIRSPPKESNHKAKSWQNEIKPIFVSSHHVQKFFSKFFTWLDFPTPNPLLC